jgi:hypothetical protein
MDPFYNKNSAQNIDDVENRVTFGKKFGVSFAYTCIFIRLSLWWV